MNYLLASLLGISLILIQCLIGGTRLVFGFPPYALVGLTAIAALFFIRKPAPKPSVLCVVSAVLLSAYVLVRAWASPIPYLARTDAFMVAACLLVYLVTALYLYSSKARLWLVYALVGMALLHIVVGILQFRDQHGFMLFGFFRGDLSPRASGQLICPNHLAGYLEAVGLMVLSLTVWSRIHVSLKLVTGYIALVCLFGLVLTGSRGGYLSVAGGIVSFALLSIWVVGIYNRQGLTRVVIAIVASAVVLFGGAGHLMTFNKHIRERLEVLSRSTQDIRIYNWAATLDQFKEAPLVGTGSGTHLWYGRLYRREALQSDPIHSHGDYLEMLAEYGIIGEAFLLLFLGLHLGFGLKTIRAITLRRLCNSLTSSRSDSLALTLGAVAAVLTLAAHSVVDFNMHIPGNALLMAFFFGILANPGTAKPETDPVWTTSLKLARAGTALGGIALLLVVATHFKGEYLTEKARVALRDGEYREAQEFAREAIAADSANFFPHFYKGEAYRASATQMHLAALRAPLFELAVESYRESLAIFPHDENALLRMGQALDGLYQFDAAQEAYLNAMRLDPNLGVIHAYYSAHLQLMGKEAEAQAALAKARKLGTKDPHKLGTMEARTILQFAPASGAIAPADPQ